MLTDPALAVAATEALGELGHGATPILLDLLQSSASVDSQAAAAKALGQIGNKSGSVELVPVFLAMIEQDTAPLTVQVEIARALGRMPDQRSEKPLQELNLKAWSSRSTDPQMQQLRQVTDWSLWQLTSESHTEQ